MLMIYRIYNYFILDFYPFVKSCILFALEEGWRYLELGDPDDTF